MSVADDTEKEKKYWQRPEWRPVSYGNPDLMAWYRGFLKRRDEGMSNEYFDIPDDDTLEVKNSLVDKPS